MRASTNTSRRNSAGLRSSRFIALLAIIACWLTVTATPAGAHAEIIASAPDANAVVSDLSEIAGQFILVEEATLTLFDPNGEEVPPTSETVMDQLTARRTFQPPELPGRYEVRWQALGIDGDLADGRFFVTLDPDADDGTTGDLSGSQTAVGLLITSLIAAVFFLFLIRRGRVRSSARTEP